MLISYPFKAMPDLLAYNEEFVSRSSVLLELARQYPIF